ncbi:MAG: metalloregulator ArsR/SmtB family transcription factor [Candidatus Glassbacteria bacterium]
MQETERLTRIFRALSVEARVKILQLLKDRALCVNSLAARLDITPAAVSQHLRILRDINLLKADKRGNFVHYTVNQDTLDQWRKVTADLLKT